MLIEERGVEEVRDAAPLVEIQACAGDAIQAGGKRVCMIEPRLLPGMEGGLTQSTVRF